MRRGLGPLVAILAATLVVWPGHTLTQRVIGIGGVDHFGTLWTWAQARLALAGDGSRLLHNPDLYFPWGMNLYRNTGGNVLDGLLAAPLAALGLPLGHNLALLLVLVANGLAAATMAPRRPAQPEARWLVGIAGALASFPLFELVEGRPTQALVAPVLVATRLLLDLPGTEGRGAPVRAGLSVALSGLFYWYYGLFLGMFAVVLGLAGLTTEARRAGGQRVLVAAALAGLLALPLAGPLLFHTLGNDVPGLRGHDNTAYVLVSFDPLAGLATARQGTAVVGQYPAFPAVGWVAVAAALSSGTSRLPRTILLVLGLALALGPTVHLGRAGFPSPAWTLLATLAPPLERLWHPSRALVLLLPLVLLGLHELPRWARPLLVAALVAAPWTAGVLPLPTWSAAPAAVDRCLAQGGREAVIDLPFAASQRNLWSQAVHGRPVAGGMHEGAPAFQPDGARALRANNALFRALIRPVPYTSELTTASEELEALGFGFVVLRLDELRGAPAEGLDRARLRTARRELEGLLGPPLWDDARALLWALGRHPLPCLGREPPPDTEPAEPVRDRWSVP